MATASAPKKLAGVLQTADRSLQVLLAFQDRPEWGVSDLGRALGLDKSVTQRLLATLARRGFVMADPQTRRYRLGALIGILARVAERGGALEAVARPYLAELAREAAESAMLNVPYGSCYRCAAAIDADGPVRYSAIVGEVKPGHGGASGHAIFAYYPPEEIRLLLGPGPLARFTDATVTSVDRLLEVHAEVRHQGVSITYGEYAAGILGASAAIHAHGEVVGSLTLIGPQERMHDKVERCAELVKDASAQLSAQLTTSAAPARPTTVPVRRAGGRPDR